MQTYNILITALATVLLSSCNTGNGSGNSIPTVAFEKTTSSVAPSNAVNVYLKLDRPASKTLFVPVTASGDSGNEKYFEIYPERAIFPAGEERAFVSIRNLNYTSADKEITVELGEMPEGIKTGTDVSSKVILTGDETANPNHFYIDNGEVRLGLDMNGGGSVFYFAESATGRNLLNHADKGRYMQQSYYGDPDGSIWNGTPWVWNPVQGGGTENTPATVLDYEFTETTARVKTRPRLWATGADVPDALMYEFISLEGQVAAVTYRFSYFGSHNHELRTQELPAFFCDLALRNLVSYDGDAPWTDAPLYSLKPGWPNEEHTTTEHWAAYVDENQWGIGLYFPNPEERMTITTYGHQGPTGPTGGGCSYFAPVKMLEIVSGFGYRYDVYMTIGEVGDIRQRFKAIRNEKGY